MHPDHRVVVDEFAQARVRTRNHRSPARERFEHGEAERFLVAGVNEEVRTGQRRGQCAGIRLVRQPDHATTLRHGGPVADQHQRVLRPEAADGIGENLQVLFAREPAGVHEHAIPRRQAEPCAPLFTPAARIEHRAVDAEGLVQHPVDAEVAQFADHPLARGEHGVELPVQPAQIRARRPRRKRAAGAPGEFDDVRVGERGDGNSEAPAGIERRPGDAIGVADLDHVRPQVHQATPRVAAADRKAIAVAERQARGGQRGQPGSAARPAPAACAATPGRASATHACLFRR